MNTSAMQAAAGDATAGGGVAGEPFVRLEDVSRSFGTTRAVRGVTLDLAVGGVVHGLVGENGAGKSTCLGLASGRIPPSSGSVLVGGAEMRSASPREFLAAGVQTVYQELTMVPALSPVANVYLGQPLSRRGLLREPEMRAGFDELCRRIGVTIPKASRTRELSVADQQMLEIMRGLVSDARAILLDEPTASLAERERQSLFRTIHGLRGEGIGVTLVSHNLDEVLEHCDRVTVFRDGRVVEARPAAEWTKRELVSAMLGNAEQSIDLAVDIKRAERPARPKDAPVALTVEHLSSRRLIRDISFELRRGEILGIAGLVGSGRTEILRAVAGLDPRATGTVHVHGARDARQRVPRTTREARRRGITLLPEDRKGQGLVLPASAADNVALGEWGRVASFGTIARARLGAVAGEAAAGVGFDPARIAQLARTFSGGNQQKLMLARWLFSPSRVLLADEPTRGVDVGAKAEILRTLERLVEGDRSMILVSSDLEEVVGLSDRVLVVNAGQSVTLLDSADGPITVEAILQHIFHSDKTQTARSAS